MKVTIKTLLIVLVSFSAHAQINPFPPLLTFTQTEVISVQPNKAVVCVEFRKSFDQVGNNKLIDIFTELEINSRLFEVNRSNVKLLPTLQDSLGFAKRALITLDDLSKLDRLYISLKQRNVRVVYTQFTHSDLNKLKQKAYLTGIRNAKVQAAELSQEFNAGLGKVYAIKEVDLKVVNGIVSNITLDEFVQTPAAINLVLHLEVSYLLN